VLFLTVMDLLEAQPETVEEMALEVPVVVSCKMETAAAAATKPPVPVASRGYWSEGDCQCCIGHCWSEIQDARKSVYLYFQQPWPLLLRSGVLASGISKTHVVVRRRKSLPCAIRVLSEVRIWQT
jgi:hypothetical protein